jgi:hypothetical protein
MKKKIFSIAAVLTLLVATTASQASLVAYADLGTANTTTPNVVTFNKGQTSALLDLDTGVPIGTLTTNAYWAGPGVGNNTEPGAGTEAYAYFNGIVNLVGYFYSNALTDGLVFSDLDPSKKYDLVITGYPGTQPTNTTGATITGADSFENVTTVGGAGGGFLATTFVTNDTAHVLQSAQSVIHFTNIAPGLDGTFAINNVSSVSYSRVGALRLEVIPEPATLSLLGLGVLGLLRRRR